MAKILRIHPVDPQERLVRQAAALLSGGGVIAYPTDSCYALGCAIADKSAQERIRRIRGTGSVSHFTLICGDVAQAASYARIDDAGFRLMKAGTPGPYTFLLRATKETPRRLQNPKRKTIGIRIPDHPVALALVEQVGQPVMSTTLIVAGDDHPLSDADEIEERVGRQIDAIVDSGSCGFEPTTVVDLMATPPAVVRQGKGPPGRLGLA